MEKRVEGIYSNVEDAMQAVDRLREKGYNHKNITVVANDEVRNRLSSNIDAEVTTEDTEDHHSMDRVDRENDDQSLWESIKDFFTMDDTYDESNYEQPDYDADNDPLYTHREAIAKGEIVVLVSGEPDTSQGMDQTDTTTDTDTATTRTDTMDTDRDDETIELREERLKVDKEKEKTGEVHVSKKVVEDTETVEVPVTKEEVTIERKPVSGDKTTDDKIDTTDEDDIVIPIEEEKVTPRKETDVVEEVEIKKEAKQDSQTVGDTVRHEELEVDDEDGHVDKQNKKDKSSNKPSDDDTLDKEISNDHLDDHLGTNNH